MTPRCCWPRRPCARRHGRRGDGAGAAVLGGIGLAISGVPYATVFTVVMLMTCLAQLGPLLVLVPSIIGLYWTGDTVGNGAAGLELRGWHHG